MDGQVDRWRERYLEGTVEGLTTKPFLVNVLRKYAQGPIVRHWLEQAANSFGSLEKREARVILGMQP